MSDAEDSGLRRSSRRSTTTNKNASILKQIQEARRNGTSYRRQLDGSELNDVYVELNEDEYQAHLKTRLQDNFVEDDDGSGYVDNGVEFLDDSDEEQDYYETKKKEKKEKTKKGGIASFFSGVLSTNKPKIDETKVTTLGDVDLEDVLADFDDDNEPDETPLVSRNQFKRTREPSPRLAPKSIPKGNIRVTPKPPKREAPDMYEIETPTEMPEPPKKKVRSESRAFSSEEPEEFDTIVAEKKPPPISNKYEPLPETQQIAEVKEPIEWDTDFNVDTTIPTDVDVKVGEELFYQTLNGSGSEETPATPIIRVYWLDAFEDPVRRPGTVYLFGKVEVVAGHYESCCVVVENVMRKVYFIPRDKILRNGEVTDEPVTMSDLYNEVKTVLKEKFYITSFKCPRESKKRLMNCENGGDICEKIDVLEVLYNGNLPKIPPETSGETFRCVANTTSTAMERLLIEAEMKGPGWINITQFVDATAKVSHCKYEFTVDMERMRNITYVKDQQQLTTPPLRMLSLNVVTTLNNNRENEIAMITCLINNRTNINSVNADMKDMQRLCFFAPPPGIAAPIDIKKRLAVEKFDSFVHQATNEKHLLNMFLSKLKSIDTDIILGHDAVSKIAKIVERLEKLKIQNWHMMGRLKRSAALKAATSKSAQWEMTAGRLILDVKNSAMELVRCKSYDLEDLTESLLKFTFKVIYPNEVPGFFSNSAQLLQLVKRSCLEPMYSIRLAAHLNALPLAFQITNVVGGVTSRTLMGGRSERNEFHLLHAFYRSDMIPPDKFQFHHKTKGANLEKTKGKVEVKKETADLNASQVELNESRLESEHDARKKAQYLGGLVLEPRKGLYDTLILLLDFNSLYPSIIQEYNICFSTVIYVDKDGSDLPPLPDPSLPEGILPQELRGLVERRRQVKSLIKKARTDFDRKQLDIRQMALKLTANSMYGCLGFQQSRFYAKPLAALVTSKGREILMHTKDLVEKLGYSVIYGDTDSIMINTNTTDLALAKKLGVDIKKQVNQCHKLLELDLDGVFQRMLLLKKKKYAAMVVNLDDGSLKKELKGLDIVRRDWAELARSEGNKIVDLLMDSSLSREEMITEIHDSLRRIRAKIDQGEVEIHEFEILKQLTRDPKSYADVNTQPHAAVARRLNTTGKYHFRSGDIVKYIICEDGTTNSATQRAYHVSELETNKNLKLDVHYYLANQLHPVISRLCEPIEEIDTVSIAEALGLDPSHYKNRTIARNDAFDNLFDESFDNCEPFKFVCPYCKETNVVDKILKNTNGTIRLTLDACSECNHTFGSSTAEMVAAFGQQLDGFKEKFTTTPYKCDLCDFECISPINVSADGTAPCERKECLDGVLRKIYGPAQLYRQQRFFETLVAYKSAQERLNANQKVEPAAGSVLDALTDMQKIVRQHILQNPYSQVDLATLFRPLNLFANV